jgi:endonuclease/exonuclease/phosphatase family metal-dependent hydrolase
MSAPSTSFLLQQTFKLASLCTTPICRAHQHYREIAVVSHLFPNAAHIELLSRKAFLFLKMAVAGSLAVITTPIGIALRRLAIYFHTHSFTYLRGEGTESHPASNSISLLSWNICCVAGGFPITDGGVTPWPERIPSIIRTIEEQNPEVLCLYEVFDLDAAYLLYDKLKHRYPHFYLNIAPKGIGVSSGLFVASKYKVAEAKFTPFPKESLSGRSKGGNRGVFGFDLIACGKAVARIFTTHLPHSEEVSFPTSEERTSRARTMEHVLEEIDSIKDRAVVLTGDLNLDDEEYQNSPWRGRFVKDGNFRGKKTWGGDHFCAQMVGKRPSAPLNLDHTLLVAKTGKKVQTSLLETGFHPEKYQKEASSDHAPLLSKISLTLDVPLFWGFSSKRS